MKTYLVGGACRDILLGVTPKDYDYVIVGGNKEDMLTKGFKKVGADFDVYLHPETGDEFALARTERKTSTGYKGFETNCEGVTLEEDLSRRDLTINSIAIEVEYEATMQLGEPVTIGTWIDPFGGIEDIKYKRLRHTSRAFSDDPVRILRVARFMARFGSEWSIHEDTQKLILDIYLAGELTQLVPERVWKEMEKSLSEKSPSFFINTLHGLGIFPILDALEYVPQKEIHHPEGNVGIHTRMAMDYASKIWGDPEIVFSLLMHDLGKYEAYERYGNALGHESLGVSYVEDFCSEWKVPNNYRDLALMTCLQHTKVHGSLGRATNKGMRPKSIMKLFEDTAALNKPERFRKMLRACQADAKGRGATPEQIAEFEARPYPQRQYLEECLDAVLSCETKSISQKLLTAGKSGPIIGLEIRAARIKSIREVNNKWKS